MFKTGFSGGLAAAGVVVFSLCGAPAWAQDVGRMEQVIRASADQGAFSGAVLVARDGEVLLDQGYGLANREWAVPNDGETRFRLGSITKQFTAAAILLLSERGAVDLDAPIRTYLTDAPAAWNGVTVRHLLTHTSGVADLTRLADFNALKTQPATMDSLIARFRDLPLTFQPGQGWAYSNSNYVLATAVIEKASGQAYADFVAKNLFQPLGMADSGYDTHAAIVPHRASGYAPGPEGVINADYVDMSIPQGAGGLYSTTRDLLKWEQGLFGGRVLKAETLRQMTTPLRNHYAMGLSVAGAGEDAVISHSGAIDGFNTYMAYDVARHMTVIVLANLNGDAPDKLGGSLMTLAQGGAVTLADERQATAMSVEALKAYEGVYEIAPTFSLTLAVTDGALTAQATGQRPVPLAAEGADAFFIAAIDAQITFTRDAAGAIEGLVLHQGGQAIPARRK